MKQSNTHIVVLIAASSLFLVLILLDAFGYTVPITKKGEPTKDDPASILTEETVLAEARTDLDSSQIAFLTALDQEKAQADNIAQEAEVLKLISRTWYEYGNLLVSGYYAKKVAELLQTGEAWGIAGTTYGTAFNRLKETDRKKLAAEQSVQALAQARELEPDSLQHRINEGLMYIELSTVDASVMPMQGVGMLQQLAQEYPDNIPVLMTLGRLSATRSGDLAKAKPRFERVLELAVTQPVERETKLEAHFFLIEAYKQEENAEKVSYHYTQMVQLTADQPGVQEQLLRAQAEYIESLDQ